VRECRSLGEGEGLLGEKGNAVGEEKGGMGSEPNDLGRVGGGKCVERDLPYWGGGGGGGGAGGKFEERELIIRPGGKVLDYKRDEKRTRMWTGKRDDPQIGHQIEKNFRRKVDEKRKTTKG